MEAPRANYTWEYCDLTPGLDIWGGLKDAEFHKLQR